MVEGKGAVHKLVAWVGGAATLQAALTIGHFAHGAHVYEDPSRYHIVVPALVAVVVVLLVAGYFVWRPSRAALWALVTVTAIPFVVVFGLYHGGFSHALKLVMYAAGMSPERLEAIFDSPDFAVPNDAMFEITGVSTLLVAGWIGYLLVRLLRAARRADGAETTSTTSNRSTAPGGV